MQNVITKKHTYERVTLEKMEVKFVFNKGQYGNFILSKNGKGYTLNFIAELTDGLKKSNINARCFIDNLDEPKTKFFNEFKIGKIYHNVNGLIKKTVKVESDNQYYSPLYIVDLGYSKPNEGLDLDELKKLHVK